MWQKYQKMALEWAQQQNFLDFKSNQQWFINQMSRVTQIYSFYNINQLFSSYNFCLNSRELKFSRIQQPDPADLPLAEVYINDQGWKLLSCSQSQGLRQ